jgi:hypothetical protein
MMEQYLKMSKEALVKELLGTQQMLGQVLLAVGEPVFVPKDTLAQHLPEGARIAIDDNDDAFVFYVEVPNDAS